MRDWWSWAFTLALVATAAWYIFPPGPSRVIAAEPTPVPEPNLAVGTKVEAGALAVNPDPNQQIMDRLDDVLAVLEYLAERAYEEAQQDNPPAAMPTVAAGVEVKPTPDPPSLNIWEDGNCWPPDHIQVLTLCGASAGDGYVLRWRGVPGDNRGPEIPDADYLANRGGGDRLIWSGNHPATGEAVTIDYWSSGHVLAVKASGRLLFRIDRAHRVQP